MADDDDAIARELAEIEVFDRDVARAREMWDGLFEMHGIDVSQHAPVLHAVALQFQSYIVTFFETRPPDITDEEFYKTVLDFYVNAAIKALHDMTCTGDDTHWGPRDA